MTSHQLEALQLLQALGGEMTNGTAHRLGIHGQTWKGLQTRGEVRYVLLHETVRTTYRVPDAAPYIATPTGNVTSGAPLYALPPEGAWVWVYAITPLGQRALADAMADQLDAGAVLRAAAAKGA